MEKPRSMQIKFLTLMYERLISQRMAKLHLDMTPTQVIVMMDLYDNQQPILQKQLETQLYISHATIRGIIKRLAAAHLVETSALPSDQRQVQVQLSPQGQQKMASHASAIKKVLDETESQLVRGIDAKELATFDRTLRKMKANF